MKPDQNQIDRLRKDPAVHINEPKEPIHISQAIQELLEQLKPKETNTKRA